MRPVGDSGGDLEGSVRRRPDDRPTCHTRMRQPWGDPVVGHVHDAPVDGYDLLVRPTTDGFVDHDDDHGAPPPTDHRRLDRP